MKRMKKEHKSLTSKASRRDLLNRWNLFKKGDINFWLVTLVIALLFMIVVFFVMGSVFNIWGETTTKVKEEQINKGLEELNIFGETNEKEEQKSTAP